ncbi:Vacuolar protein-sorting-associated protein 28 [Varicellaria rhodocarpa]|nr:Vacuolar protein-sorting-associated protein 28 [Varicellaria rhodocarpa]
MYAPPRQLPYAPTPYSYPLNPSLSATINLDEEVKVSTNSAERDLYDSLAEIYGIIIALDGLEKAYLRDFVTESEYTEICSRLLKQYQQNLNDDTVAKEFVDLETFKKSWDIECPRATERLRVGLPATISHPAMTSQPSQPTFSATNASAKQVAAATENFITLTDALKLGYNSKDQLHPLLSEVIQAVNKVTEGDFEGRAKIIAWLIKLNAMRAGDELAEGDVREMLFEMEGAYYGFKATLD